MWNKWNQEIGERFVCIVVQWNLFGINPHE